MTMGLEVLIAAQIRGTQVSQQIQLPELLLQGQKLLSPLRLPLLLIEIDEPYCVR